MRIWARVAACTASAAAVISGLGVSTTTAHAAAGSHPPAAAAAPARPLDNEPAPSCSDNNNTVPCWEYQTWYWTYDNCNKAGTNAVNADRGKFDNHVCVLTGNGVGVGLWLHKLHD
ncbi:hypothetical protein ACH4PU_30020 [Streptomyces sp. NPDC021100]|uniref:hypothetical protein n=1 Tax=Streptomyces sp. NPDC021100 TaxID=3365114 RepID=UPI00378CD5F7